MFKTENRVWILVIIVLMAGMVFPELMDTDAAEYAGISMRMFRDGDFGNIINRSYDTGLPYDYLDKPHVLFWSSLPGYALFGVNEAGYRFITVLISLLAALTTYRLGALLYDRRVGRAAALMFACTQAILLSNHDVRTDSLLTSFCVMSIYHIIAYLKNNKPWSLVWAGAFLAAAVGTKGMIAVLTCGSACFFYILGTGWKKIFSWNWLILLLSFFVFLSPLLYYYYLQFDLHPEKYVNGGYGHSGIKFILWTQSFERFAGGRGLVSNPQYDFFFHTLLWALAPWSIIYYLSVFSNVKELVRTRARSFFTREQLTFTGIWILFFVMSLSKFKLPHYLNVFFPLMCIATAAYLYRLYDQGGPCSPGLKIFRKLQGGLIILIAVVAVLVNVWVFPVKEWWIMAAFLMLLTASVIYLIRLDKVTDDLIFKKIVMPSALAVLLFNFLLNTNFYPRLGTYQGGSSMARMIKEKNYELDDIYLYDLVVRSFDFNLQRWPDMLSDEDIEDKLEKHEPVLIFTGEEGRDRLEEKFSVRILEKMPDYRITRLTGKFLNPATRPAVTGEVYLISIESNKPF